MRLQPVKIRIDDDGSKRRPDPPPEKKRGIGEFFRDLVSDCTEKERGEARKLINRVIQDLDTMRPDANDTAEYAAYIDMSNHLGSLRSDIMNGGWKGFSAARQVLREFQGYDNYPAHDRVTMLPNRLQALMP